MTGEVTEYLVLDFIDDMEEAIYNAEKHDMADVAERLNGLHDDLLDLGNIADSEDKVERLKMDIEKPLQELVAACQAGENAKAGDSLRILSDKMDALKNTWIK